MSAKQRSGSKYKKRRRDWQNPPPIPGLDVISSVAFNGLPIGNCLQQALNDMLNESEGLFEVNVDDNDDNNGNDHSSNGNGGKEQQIKVTSDVTDAILNSFGRAVANTKWRRSSISNSESGGGHGKEQKKVSDEGIAQSPEPEMFPPAALLIGRLDHYNRVNQNWKIVIDNVKLKPRNSNDDNEGQYSIKKKKTLNRRKSDRESIFLNTSVEKEEEEGQQEEITINGQLHIHAYDDV